MKYTSTRDSSVNVTSAEAIAKGISDDGGLFLPECVLQLSKDDFMRLCKAPYIERAKAVLKLFLDDFTDDELDYCLNGAYKGTFDNDEPAPLHKLRDGRYMLELWHGPTCAFKDLALQLLPFLLTTAAKKVGKGRTVILVATSGDTGKAALEGFHDVDNTDIIVFYPDNGVSPMQKLQMDTQKGKNVFVSAIKGNFDDAQSGVKKIFTDPAVKEKLKVHGMEFSSANSINWGRLVPQIVYYVSTYCDLLNDGADLSDGFDVVVPTGNFGNILAAYYAKSMGVPIKKLVCASNANNVLTDFISTGIYDRNREFFLTRSPSMDILISSNLERMLYILNGSDKSTFELESELTKNGKFEIDGKMIDALKEVYACGCCDDKTTLSTIKDTFEKYGYLCDTHTAVAVNVADRYVEDNSVTRPTVVVSTASPYKFSKSVLEAVAPELVCDDEFLMVDRLSEVTKAQIPSPISALKTAVPRFKNVCEKQDMVKTVFGYLGI